MGRAGESARSQERRLIMENLANGVSLGDVARAFQKSEKEIWEDVRYVVGKMQAYCIKHCREVPRLDDIVAIRTRRDDIHWLLERINLDLVSRYSRIRVETLDKQTLKSLRGST